jgi:3-deoxy-D-manno-octulosonic-acid transferase
MAKSITERTLPLRIYRALSRRLGPLVGSGLLRWRLAKGKEMPIRVRERRGRASIGRPEGTLVWLHAASVGELLAIMPLVEAIGERGLWVLVTTGTVTSARLAHARLPQGAVHQFLPLDVPLFMRRFLRHWQPDLAILAESELWPNLLLEANMRDMPVILSNARMSERSFRRWRHAGKTIAALLHRIDLCLAQSPGDAKRLLDLGAPRVETGGNLKFDVPPPPADPQLLEVLKRGVGNRPVLVCASTHPGEDAILTRVHIRVKEKHPDLLTIIIPRHPDRASAVTDRALGDRLNVQLRSDTLFPDSSTDIYVADTIGELGLFYRLGHVAFIGGSLVKHGGQNPIEPAKVGIPILHGPHVRNFADIYNALDNAQGALLVDDEETLAIAVAGLITDKEACDVLRRTAGNVIVEFGGALQTTLAAIEPYLMQIRLGKA